jgi:hypothetical protein
MVALQQRIPDPVYLAQARARHAWALVECHRSVEARRLLHITRRMRHQGRSVAELDWKTAARITEYLAIAELECGNFDAARAEMNRALRERAKLQNPLGIASARFRRGEVLLRTQEWAAARVELQKCLRTRKRFRARLDQARALNILAKSFLYEAIHSPLTAALQQKRLRQGLACAERAMGILNTHRAPRERARAYWLRGELNARLGRKIRLVISDLNAVLEYDGDPILLVKAHKALVAIRRYAGDWRRVEYHASETLRLLKMTKKLLSWEEAELKAYIREARAGQ